MQYILHYIPNAFPNQIHTNNNINITSFELKINTKITLKLVNEHFRNKLTVVPCLIYKCYLDNFRLIHQ
ncbi:unnamed protein product [Schistosoma spindalis]|nr:unnamed protein product [Schistosoma spindale]